MKRYIIGLMTLLTASVLPLVAQGVTSGLTLEKNGEQVLIPMDERVAVSTTNDLGNMFYGNYLGMTVDALRIQEKGESFERDIPIDEISSIFRGKTKSTQEYVRDGAKIGRLVAIGTGGLISSIFLVASGFDLEALPSIFIFGGLWTVISGIVTVPAGALIGYGQAQIAEENAVEYVIGDGQWVIIN